MSVVITGGLLVEEFHVVSFLVLVVFEVEVRFSLDLSVDILSEAFLFLSLDLLIEAELVELLLKKGANSFLDVLDMLVVIVIDGGNAREDTFLLLRAAQLREPFSFSGVLLGLLAKVGLCIVLELLILNGVEGWVNISVLLKVMSGLISTDECLHGSSAK